MWSGDDILAELNGSYAVTAQYVYGTERIYNCINNNYYLYNNHGDTSEVINMNGSVVKSYTINGSDAYGDEKNPDSSDTNPFRYCGEYYDAETGNIYLRARYYDPGTGSFITEDPAKDGVNWHSYCGGNPVRFIDPSGLTYLIGWSYSKADLKDYERYSVDQGKNLTVDGETDDWTEDDWADFTNKNSFARAAYTRREELLNMGVNESEICIQRIDNHDDLVETWAMWSDYSLVEGLDFYSHGYEEGAEVCGGSEGFWIHASKLNFGECLRLIDGKGIITQPYAVFYGCNTANGNFAQNFADTQGVNTYAQTTYSSFSHSKTHRKNITTYEEELTVYLLSFESTFGLRNKDGVGQKFTPSK